MTALTRFIKLRRVSTREQGRSGLGLDAQARDLDLYLSALPPESFEVLADLVEVESGGSTERPVLAEALALAKRTGGTILVAKLDRLSRDVEVIAGLIKRAPFRVATMPQADSFQLHIYAALAEQERKFIGQRTRAALASAKTKGVRLGGTRPKTEARNAALVAQADAFSMKVATVAAPMREAGQSLDKIARALTTLGVETARGGAWTATAVRNVLARVEAQATVS